MLKKGSFIFSIFFVFMGLAWWSTQVGSQSPQNLVGGPSEQSGIVKFLSASESVGAIGLVPNPQKNEELKNEGLKNDRIKNELVETLDRIVDYQHYYHSVYGHYTQLMNRIGFDLPSDLAQNYDIRVAEASADRLLVSAFSELNGKTHDLVSIDQDYQVHANFDLPLPRSEYLRGKAIKFLRLLQDVPLGQSLAEQGVFKGYFKYSTKLDSKNEKKVFAEGVRAPVLGLQLDLESEMDPVSHDSHSGYFPVTGEHTSPRMGQQGLESSSPLEEEAYLAQKIFRGEVGRYAKTWAELSQIAHFKFEGKDQYQNDFDIPGGDLTIGLNLENNGKTQTQTQTRISRSESDPLSDGIKLSAPSRRITSHNSKKSLEIEPISPEETQ